VARVRKEELAQLGEARPTDVQGFLDWLEHLMADVPPEAWEDVPADLAQNHEHYLLLKVA
jgi:hypothetical protein